MIEEVHRVLQPGGRYITLSLHDTTEVIPHFQPFQAANQLNVNAYMMKSNRWNEAEHRRRAVAHSMIVAEKSPLRSLFPPASSLTSLVLTDEEYKALQARSRKINFTAALHSLSDLQVRFLLLRLLHGQKSEKNNYKHLDDRTFMESYCQTVAIEARNTLYSS